MNKIFKSYKTNNHGGKEIELDSQVLLQPASGARTASATGLPTAVEVMSKTSENDWRTVQALAQELDEEHQYDGVRLYMSNWGEKADLSAELYSVMLSYYWTCFSEYRFCSWIASLTNDLTHLVTTDAIFFDHIVINQSHYTFVLCSNASAEALIVVCTNDAGVRWVGELLEIFSITQAPIETQQFEYMCWLVPYNGDIAATAWQESC
ncbi:uncharacterized protein PHACADRAFT_30530 [Phanerochaete carnosa HHB-10118-sp]|uniref:Uncharacterized protein n=1 Tax=Phanerochaete carnosa (strain HHB-10118-sp) TaxID=650164 RepID=K5W325_PHACS|nr:uncharacterized protein PHACADRAFT_30530 [Phanerochaete carnosa HHB-10118-sp]EKM53540.1 hypothetical protein PHACADRAFT_30530 [Phanerochaete carnosa HHB-10118-sp]